MIEPGAQLALPLDVTVDGEIRVYTLTFPYLPPSKNTFDQLPTLWKSGMKKKWMQAIKVQCAEQQIPLGVPQIGLAAVLVFASHGRRDPQNYAQQLWNWVPDGLVKVGVISDDRDGKIDFGPNLGVQFAYDLRKGVDPKKRSRTVLSVSMIVPNGVQCV